MAPGGKACHSQAAGIKMPVSGMVSNESHSFCKLLERESMYRFRTVFVDCIVEDKDVISHSQKTDGDAFLFMIDDAVVAASGN